MDEKTLQGGADIIIPVYNQYASTRNLLEGIYRYTDHPFQIYLIDNASTDETVDLDKIYQRQISVVRNRENRGWCGGINQGIRLGNNPYVVFLNNDVEVSHGWLGNMIAFLETHPRIGAVGPLDSSPNDWQCVDRVREKMVPQIPRFLTEDLHERNRILRFHFHRTGVLVEGMLAFFCCVMRRRTISAIGDLDEDFEGGGDDDDYCRRLRKAGYVLGLCLDTYVVHHSNLTSQSVYDEGRRKELRKKNLVRLKEKHPEYF
jgi:GT2 family glycosyltransferase